MASSTPSYPDSMEDPPKKMHKSDPSYSQEETEVISDAKAFVERFTVLFNSPFFSDIKLHVGDQVYYGHRFILASASKVFE